MVTQLFRSVRERASDAHTHNGNPQRRQGMINFLTWAFFLSEAFGHSEALATGLHSADSDAARDGHGSDPSSPLSLSRPDGALLVQNPEPSTVSVETTTLYQQGRMHEFAPAGGHGDGPGSAPGAGSDAATDHYAGSGGGDGGDGGNGGGDATLAAADLPADTPLAGTTDLGMQLDLQLPDTVDALLDQTFGTLNNVLGTVDSALDNTLDSVTSTLSPVVSLLDHDAVSGLTGTVTDAITPVTTVVTSLTSAVTSDLGGALGSSGSLRFGSSDGPLAGSELSHNGLFTDFGISLQAGPSDATDSTSASADSDQGVLGSLDILHFADGGDTMDTHLSHDGLVRIASDVLT